MVQLSGTFSVAWHTALILKLRGPKGAIQPGYLAPICLSQHRACQNDVTTELTEDDR